MTTRPPRLTSAARAKSALVAERRERAVALRAAGMSNTDIGLLLAADPAINPSGQGVPEGYGADRYAKGAEPPTPNELSRMVSQDISRALTERAKRRDAAVDEMRELEQQRLEALHRGVWPSATTGDPQAITAALRIAERRAKLFGLDAAHRLEVAGRGGGPVEVRVYSDAELLALADGLIPGDPDDTDPDTDGADR